MESLWPEDVSLVEEKAPVTILREQASLLGQRTKNLVTAEVRAVDPEYGDFAFAFYIVGPALGDYRYKLFTVWYYVELYPVSFVGLDYSIVKECNPMAEVGDRLEARSRRHFVELLGWIFKAKKTRHVIEAILAQSGVEPGGRP